MRRLLFVHSRNVAFHDIDREALRERYEVEDHFQPGPRPDLRTLVAKVRRCDVVFGWFAHWHTLWALALARRLRKPSVLVVGGFDTASMPEIGYGHQRGGIRRLGSRWTMAQATRLVTNSHASLREIERNIGSELASRVRVIHHGVPDRFGDAGAAEREPIALTVGIVIRDNLARKGLRPFVEAASSVSDAGFVIAGRWADGTHDELAARAPLNVRFTGWLPDEELDDWYRRAAVYVQPSLHEGFGMSVAEAMLAGCVPVVSTAGALPEVVGDAGIQMPGTAPADVAEGVRQGLELGPEARERARRRVLEEFPLQKRKEGLWEVVEEALAAGGRGRR